MSTLYDDDVIAWVEQQVALLRAGRWSELDIDNIVEEIEDVGKSEKRELRHRMAVLVEHLTKWHYQPARRGPSWSHTIRAQRNSLNHLIRKAPSLRRVMADPDFAEDVWREACSLVQKETCLSNLPDVCPWTLAQAVSPDFLPDGEGRP